MLLIRLLLALSVLASAAVAVVVGFAVYLFIESYSGGGSPTSVAGLAFPLALVVLLVAGLPAVLICACSWFTYVTLIRRRRRRGQSSL